MKDNCYNVIKCTLKLLRIPSFSEYLFEEINGHPDYRSLLCISDVLGKHGIETSCIKSTHLEQLPSPFIAPIAYENQVSFVVVKSYTENHVTISHPLRTSWEKIKVEDFVNNWTNVALVIEQYKKIHSNEYLIIRNNYYLRRIASYMAIIVIGTLWLNGFLRISSFENPSKFLLVIYYALSLLGITVCLLLLLLSINKNNSFLQRVCKVHSKGDCNAVITSNAGSLWEGGITWSEIGFYYFTGIFLSLITSNFKSIVIGVLFLLNFTAVPYVLFSIYYQWRVIKSWCVLCMVVQAILVFNAIISFIYFSRFNDSTPSVALDTSILLSLCFTLPFICWTFIKPLLKTRNENSFARIHLARIRNNRSIFNYLLDKQETFPADPNGLGIILGNRYGGTKITMVSQPYCKSCIESHKYIEELLDSNSDIQVQIVYYVDSKLEQDTGALQARNFLALAEKYDESIIRHVLMNWSKSSGDHVAFATQYGLSDFLSKQNEMLNNMRNWCEQSSIDQTPAFFINGKKLPELYSIRELKNILIF